ncbi:MAG TPA: membrane protein insertase YidC, partial [Alphaproteobacteria bacterium]
ANKSYRSFAKLKQISPQMKELRDKFGGDKEKLQAGLVGLYEKEKVNPLSGCLPILVQIPIFFALYKVLSISIEMRHAPFFGWVHDLSAKDPTTIFNLFGLIPWNPPDILHIGIWPCLMLLGMLVQKRMNPPPQDPTQAMMINYMPYFMTYIMSGFAAGLVIYWTFSNVLSVIQQYIIMRSMGVPVYLFSKDRENAAMEDMVKEGPNVHPELEVAEDEIEASLTGKGISPPKGRRKKKK